MIKTKIAPQIEFSSLDEFIQNQKNFFRYFLPDHLAGMQYRNKPPFKRFRIMHMDIEEKVRKEISRAIISHPKQELPYELLWQAYQLMSKLVYPGDRDVTRDGKIDDRYLTR